MDQIWGNSFYCIFYLPFTKCITVILEKLTRQMSGDDNNLRTKILKEINEDFHDGGKLNFALDSSDILLELVNCFEEQDEPIRELSSRAIIKVACTQQCRQIVVEDEIIPKIRFLFDD